MQSLYSHCISNAQMLFEMKKLFKIKTSLETEFMPSSLPLLSLVFHTANWLSQEAIHICLPHDTIKFVLSIYLCFSSFADFWAWERFTFSTILLA